MHYSKVFTALASVLVSTAGLSFSSVVSAQAETNTELEEIVVTASRREEALQDVAMAVSVVDISAQARAGVTTLPEVLSFVPGVSVVDSGANFNNQVYIRGINSVLAAGVATYVDEIPFGSSTLYTTPAPLDGTVLDVGVMDVLKGPQGTLYGASAMGGMLKFNTREPSLEEWSGDVSADLSSTEGGGLNQLYRLNANGPIATDTFGVSFTGFWKEKTGYIDNVVIPIEGWDDYEYYGGSGSLRWAPTDKLEIKLSGLYQNSTQEGLASIEANYAQDQLMPGIGAGEPWYGEYETGQADVNPSEFEANMVGLTIEYEFDFATLTSVTSSQELSFVQNSDLTVPYAAFADIFFPANAPHTAALFVGDLGFEKFTQEFRLTSPSTETFEWIVGAFYTEEDGHNIQELITTPVEPFYFANFPSNYEELSLFATGTYYFTPDFDVSVGLRYADYSNDVQLTTVGPLVAPIPLTEIKDDVTNYLFNMRYRAGDKVSYYGRIASGYRPGGANFLLLDPVTGDPITEPFVQPDKLVSYEFGIKGVSESERFGYEIAAFFIDWQDYQINVIRGGLQVAANAEEASSKGAEASLSFAATDAFTIKATLAYTNAELDVDEPDLGGAKGDQLPNSPEWQSAVDLDYQFQMGNVPAYVGASWRYKGEMPVGFEGYTDSNGTDWPPSSPRVLLDSYNLVDLRAGATFGRFDTSLYVTNVFDEWAYTNFGPSFSAASLGTPTRPRTIGAVISLNFF